MSEVGSEIDASFFGSPDYVPVERDINMASARAERGILPDAQERLERLLENKGWKQITEVEGDGELPLLDEWVDHRITNRRGTKFFPCFVTDEQGQISFLKTQVSNDSNSLKSLAREAIILKKFNEMGYPSPKFYDYEDGNNDTLAFIRLEAMTPDQGRTAAAVDWREEHARSAIEQIRNMEKADLRLLPKELMEIGAFQTSVRVTETMMDLANRAGEFLTDDIRNELSRLKKMGEEIRTVLVHGDMTLKNIVIDNKGGVLPVDFELAKIGFLGQDAGKLLSGLRENPEVFKVALESYLDDGNGSIDQDRLRALTIGMATENLVHIVWRVENSQIDNETLSEIGIFVDKIKNALSIEEEFRSKMGPEPVLNLKKF